MLAVQVILAAIGALLAINPINAISPDSTLIPADVNLARSIGDVPQPQARSRLRQTTRSEVLKREARRRLGLRDTTSSIPAVCVADTTPATRMPRGAVLTDVIVNSSYKVSGIT